MAKGTHPDNARKKQTTTAQGEKEERRGGREQRSEESGRSQDVPVMVSDSTIILDSAAISSFVDKIDDFFSWRDVAQIILFYPYASHLLKPRKNFNLPFSLSLAYLGYFSKGIHQTTEFKKIHDNKAKVYYSLRPLFQRLTNCL